MAKSRMINTHFWKDAYIRKLQAGDKLLFLYLLTNPSTNIAGAYEITLDEIASDTGMAEKRILESIERLTESGKVEYRDSWILVKNFIKHQTKSESVEKGIVSAINCCPDWIKDTIITRYAHLATYLNLKSNLKSNLTKRRWKPEVVEVFEEWKSVLNKKSPLDAKRHSLLADRLKEFTVAQLKLVPHGASLSPWHMGINPKKKKYLDVSTLYRDAEQVERFIEAAQSPATVISTVNTHPRKTAADYRREADAIMEADLVG
jgi:hypothetical protein